MTEHVCRRCGAAFWRKRASRRRWCRPCLEEHMDEIDRYYHLIGFAHLPPVSPAHS